MSVETQRPWSRHREMPMNPWHTNQTIPKQHTQLVSLPTALKQDDAKARKPQNIKASEETKKQD